MTITIEKGIRRIVSKYTFDEMELGDSFAVSSDNEHRVRSAADRHQRRNKGWKYSLRWQKDGTYRLWRIA